MDIDRDTLLVTVYTLIDGLLQQGVLPHKPTRPGSASQMSDSEVLTMLLCGQWLGNSDRDRLRDEPALAELVATFGTHGLYRCVAPPLPHRVVATFDRLEPGQLPAAKPVILPCHWLDGLTSPTPGVTLVSIQLENNPAPCIRIIHPNADDALICLRGRCGEEQHGR